MKRTYHLCWSGGDEILCRRREDYIHCIICLCIAAHESGSKLLAYCIMSNHVHICIRSEDIHRFITKFRYSYTRFYNSKYHRRGRLGERKFFTLELKGLYHILAAISYILRNPLHHGICMTPFEYEFSSITGVFTKELGYATAADDMTEWIAQRKLPSRNNLPSGVKFSRSGRPLPETIIDMADVEHMFSSARTYIYYMNRISGEEWEKEQEKDRLSTSTIKLDDIETGVHGDSIRDMLNNEHGRGRRYAIEDLSLCEKIDRLIAKYFPQKTVYTICHAERAKLASRLSQEYHISRDQLSRCLRYQGVATQHKNG